MATETELTIKTLEAAYSRMIFDSVPARASSRRDDIVAQLLVIDASESGPARLRSLTAPEPPRTYDGASVRGMVVEILNGVVEDAMEAAQSPPDAAMITGVVVNIRHKLERDGVDPHVLAWALPAQQIRASCSVIHERLLREIEGGQPSGGHTISHYVSRSLKQAGTPEEVFVLLVQDVLLCTRNMPTAHITVDQVEAIHMRALPFCGLGVLRGIA